MPRISKATIAHIDRTATHLNIPQPIAWTLRRAAMTLHRWYEGECGDRNDYSSWAIERDETTGKPYHVVHPHAGGKPRRTAIRDMEAGALRTIARVCAEQGLYYLIQADPRGGTLYLSRQPLTAQNCSSVGRMLE